MVVDGGNDNQINKITLRLGLLLFLGLVFFAFFVFNLDKHLSFETLRDYRLVLKAYVDEHTIIAPIFFIIVYFMVVVFSLPGGFVMTVTAGFLFDPIMGAIYAIVGATLGASALFLISRITMGEFLRARAKSWINKLQVGFQRHAFSYLLILRLVPIFPFFIVNLVPGFLGVPFFTYISATFLGLIPASFVFASFGAGLDDLFDLGTQFGIKEAITPEMLLALMGLVVLVLSPFIYRFLGK